MPNFRSFALIGVLASCALAQQPNGLLASLRFAGHGGPSYPITADVNVFLTDYQLPFELNGRPRQPYLLALSPAGVLSAGRATAGGFWDQDTSQGFTVLLDGIGMSTGNPFDRFAATNARGSSTWSFAIPAAAAPGHIGALQAAVLDPSGFAGFTLSAATDLTLRNVTDLQPWTAGGSIANRRVGTAVANVGDVDGDGHTEWAVGTPGNGTSVTGRVTLYSGITGGVLWHADGATAGDLFGVAIAEAFDVDDDGVKDLLVGAPHATPMGSFSGRAKVLSGADGSTIHQIDGGATFLRLGSVVAGLGDTDGDFHSDFAVVTLPISQAAGLVTIHSGADASILRTINPPTGSTGFGTAFIAAGDLDGDGITDYVAGAPGTSGIGEVIAIRGSDGSTLYRVAGSNPGDEYGTSIAAAGDLDGDGTPDLFIGAPQSSGTGAGYAALLSGVDGTLIQNFSGSMLGDQFGQSVSAGRDVNGDGTPDLLAGAPQLSNGTLGYARLIDGSTKLVLTTLTGTANGDAFGAATALIDDLSMDGRADVLIGAPRASQIALNAGRAEVHLLP